MSQFLRSCSSNFGGHALDGDEYVEKGDDLVSWKMPRVDTGKVYKRKRFSLFSNPTIRTVERKFSFGNHGGYVRLIDQEPRSVIKGKSYRKLNVGMVQVGVKTLTRKIPSTASIVLCLRDNRIESPQASLLGMVQSSLSDGPFYFNLFPNVTLPLSYSFLLDVLTLNVSINGLEELPEGSEPILLMCRTCYKLIQSSFGPEALLESPTGKTVFFQTEIRESNDVVQKVTMWDQVQLPPNWPPKVKKRTTKTVFENGTVRLLTQYE